MKIYFVSLGCDKNKVDSEKILDFFISKYNVEIVDDPDYCDIAIVNTCAFIGDAKKESIEVIKDLYERKQQGKIKKIMAVGCLAKECKINGFDNSELSTYADEILPVDEYLSELDNMTDRVIDVVNYSRPIKISDGCDKNCTYCIIPRLRGKQVSRKIDDIVLEVEKMTDLGLVELEVVAQDTLSYGIDLYKKKSIVELLTRLSNIEKLKWIRLMYCYPEEITDDLIQLMKTNKKILHYIDMPIQHISDKVLRSMNRATTKENIKSLIYKLRNEIPDISLRTTLMVGFPGETDDDFSELVDFVEEIGFDHVGCFAYSREKLSTSYDYANQVPEEEKEKRKNWIMSVIQYRKVLNHNQEQIGNKYEVIIDGYDTNKNMYVARNYQNAKNIDSVIYIKSKKELLSGTFAKVKITGFDEYDLLGKML